MVPRDGAAAPHQRLALFLVVLMSLSVLPLVATTVSADGARDAAITVTPIPNALEVNPGEAGEYTIRVRNTGSNPVTVSLSTSQEATQECNGYSSSITQIPGPIESGAYEEATMNVTLTQTAEGTCDTTVTVNANEQATPPDVAGAPAQETTTVTTTAGDGSGSAVFGVDLTVNSGDKEQDWAGEDELTYRIEVENTGQTNETIALTVDENTGPGCGSTSEFTVSLSDTSINLDSEDVETIIATVEIPDGQSADDYCWDVTGTVTNDPSTEAKDTDDFKLIVPQLKTCSVELSKTSLSVNPDEEASLTATFTNTGNVDWTVSIASTGSKAGWISVDGASSRLLRYDNGEGTVSVDLDVSPDDSIDAGSEAVITILGKDGSSVDPNCQKQLRVVVGQSYGASISLATTLLNGIDPGTNKSTVVTVANQGNGQDNLRISSSSAPSGWAIQLEQSTVLVGSRHGNQDSVSVDLTIRVPQGALATEAVEITLSVLPSGGGATYDSVVLRVTVGAIHDFEVVTPATEQTGRSLTDVSFPIEISNLGNVRDRMALSVVDQSQSPEWDTVFEDENGMQFTEINLDPQTVTTVYLVVSIPTGEELDNTLLTVRVRNKDDTNTQDLDNDGIPDNQREVDFLAILSDRNFAMSMRLVDGETAKSGSKILPPNGEVTYGLWVSNMGDGRDEAVFTMDGLEGIATRSLTLNGLPVSAPINIPNGYGIWDIANETFVLEDGAPILGDSKSNVGNQMLNRGLMIGHEAKVYEIYFELTIRVSPGAETGQGGLLEVVVTSVSNAANRTGMVSIMLDVSVIQDLEFIEAGARQELDLVYGGKAIVHEISIVNTGNVPTEIRVFTSENLRGWSVVLNSEDGDCSFEQNELMCMVDEGERLYVNATIRAPYGAELSDTYKFTLSAEPTDTGVLDRQNLQFVVQGEPTEGVLDLAGNTTAQAIGATIIVVLLLLFLVRRD
jgi:uncharacterized membrane protein